MRGVRGSGRRGTKGGLLEVFLDCLATGISDHWGDTMRTLAIVFGLAVVGGIAPAAPVSRGYLSTAVLLFAASLLVFLAGCVMAGWLVSERRTIARMASAGRAAMPTPTAEPLPRVLSVNAIRWVPRPVPAERSRLEAAIDRASATIVPRLPRREPAVSRSLD